MKKTIELLEALIKDPEKGLPQELFLLISKLTPMINVDLLIKNEAGHTLLTWRDDGFYSAGWHIPGGIIRYKETMATRIKVVAKTELGAEVQYDPEPLVIKECVHNSRKVRGHFISLLYKCKLTSPLDNALKYQQGAPGPGQWAWHDKCPGDLLEVQQMYREYI